MVPGMASFRMYGNIFITVLDTIAPWKYIQTLKVILGGYAADFRDISQRGIKVAFFTNILPFHPSHSKPLMGGYTR